MQTLFCAATEAKWTLAAHEFEFTQEISSSSQKALSRLIPEKILEHITENLSRMPRIQERLERKLYELEKDRLSLFLQLSAEVKKRDEVFLNGYSKRVLKTKISEYDKKIADIQKKIDVNVKEEKKQIKEFEAARDAELSRLKQMEEGKIVSEETKKKNFFSSIFKDLAGNGEELFTTEKIVLYQNDFTKLFSVDESIQKLGYESFNFEKACVDAGIRGLVTGKITIYGQYFSVQVTVYQYPGGRVISNAMEAGRLDDLSHIADRLAGKIVPRIADTMPVELVFEITPEEVVEDLIMSVDDVVFKTIPENLTISSGIHTIGFSAENYSSVSTSYSFTGSRKFNIRVEMLKDNPGMVQFALKNPISGEVFRNSVFSGNISPSERFSSISINNRPVLGRFISEEGFGADFIIDSNLIEDKNILIADVKPFDRSAYIDKRRRWLYGSYSALIVSLAPTFYTYGNYNAAVSSYNTGSGVSYETALGWKAASNICTGVSIGAACFFIYELIRYFNAANSVLPVEAKKAGKKQMDILEKEMEKSLNEISVSETDNSLDGNVKKSDNEK